MAILQGQTIPIALRPSEASGGLPFAPGQTGGSSGNPFPSGAPGSSGFGADNGGGNGNYGPDLSGLSSAAIAGIAVGSILVFFAVVALLVWLCIRGGRRRNQQQHIPRSEGAQGRQPPNLESLPRQGRHRQSQNEETVAFAKIASASRVRLPDDPPAYEETEQHNPQHGTAYAMGSVSDGFRRYSMQPPDDAEPKPGFDALGHGSNAGGQREVM